MNTSDSPSGRQVTNNKWFWLLIALGVGCAVAAVGVMAGWWDWGAVFAGVGSWLLFVASIVAYFVPTIVAVKRKHRSTGGIVALNILTGWTFIGWIIALVWSLSSAEARPVVVQQYVTSAPTQYQAGDVVNGHRFNGQTWEPLA